MCLIEPEENLHTPVEDCTAIQANMLQLECLACKFMIEARKKGQQPHLSNTLYSVVCCSIH